MFLMESLPNAVSLRYQRICYSPLLVYLVYECQCRLVKKKDTPPFFQPPIKVTRLLAVKVSTESAGVI